MNSYFDQLEDYLAGKLDPAVRDQLESELKSNDTLAQALNDLQTAKLVSKSLIEFETRQQLKNLKSSGRSIQWIYRIAAVILIGIGGMYLFRYYLNTSKLDAQEIYTSLYEKAASVSNRTESDLKNLLDTAIFHFDHSNLNQSQSELIQYLSIFPNDEKAKRYLSHVYLQTSQYNLAEPLLLDLSNTNNDSYQQEANYHLCMLYLMRNDKSSASKYYERFKNNKLIPALKLKKIESLL